MKNNINTDFYICACSSFEHQIIFWKGVEGFNEIYIEVHLNNSKSFYKRLIYAIKYIFGYKSRYGAWDEFIFCKDDLDRLKETLNINKQ